MLNPTWGPEKVHGQLADEGHDISLRTVQRKLPAFRDPSGAWRLDPVVDTDHAFVLSAVAAIADRSDGYVQHVTRSEAAWIGAIHAAAPDLGAESALWMAKLYIAATAAGEDTGYLDVTLALRPWRELDTDDDASALFRWGELVELGRVRDPLLPLKSIRREAQYRARSTRTRRRAVGLTPLEDKR